VASFLVFLVIACMCFVFPFFAMTPVPAVHAVAEEVHGDKEHKK
jgi:hypothetical protein